MRRALTVVLLLVPHLARADATLPTNNALVLDPDVAALRLTVETELATLQRYKPTSVAPDVWLGLTSRLTIGVIHSNSSVSRIDRGSSFCFRHTFYGCNRTYHNAGLDVRYGLRRGDLAVAAHARLLLRAVDPYKPAVTLGVAVRWSTGRVTLSSDPYVRAGLENTDRGNRTNIMVPLVASLRTWRSLELALHTGYDSDVEVWADGYHVPVAFSLRGQVTRHVELGALVGWTSLLGPQNTLARSTGWAWLGWRS